jgi:hypothetical protein
MSKTADDLKVGDIVTADFESWGTPSFGLERDVLYRVSKIHTDGYIPTGEVDDNTSIELEYMDGTPFHNKHDDHDRSLSILWVCKVKKPTNKERIEAREAKHAT